MLGAHFETQMEQLFKAFLNAFNGEDYTKTIMLTITIPNENNNKEKKIKARFFFK